MIIRKVLGTTRFEIINPATGQCRGYLSRYKRRYGVQLGRQPVEWFDIKTDAVRFINSWGV